MTRSLTIIVPAYNEAARVASVVTMLVGLGQQELDSFEIIVVNDGSRDRTGAIADELAAQYPEVRAIHQPRNAGVGAAYTAALHAARMPMVTLVPGDNAFAESGVRDVFRTVGAADMIITYRANPSARSPVRRVLSVICNRLLRLATRAPLRDGHSMYVWPTAWAREISTPPDYRYHLVSLTTLFARAETYCEIPVLLNPKPDESSGVMRFSVVWGLGTTMLGLLLRSSARRHRPRRVEADPHQRLSKDRSAPHQRPAVSR